MRATVVVLPVPGPPATTAKPMPHGGRGRGALAVVAVAGAEQAVEPGVERRRRRSPRASPAAGDEAVGDRQLLAPVAVEVEAGALEAQRAAASRRPPTTSGLAATAASHASASGHGRASRSTASSSSLVAVAADGRQVDAHVGEARGPDGEGDGEQDVVVGLAAERAEARGDVDVGGVEHAGDG